MHLEKVFLGDFVKCDYVILWNINLLHLRQIFLYRWFLYTCNIFIISLFLINIFLSHLINIYYFLVSHYFTRWEGLLRNMPIFLDNNISKDT